MSKFELRELKAEDIFSMTKLIKAFGVEEFKNIFIGLDFSEGTNNQELGINIVFGVVQVIIENLDKCKNELYSFLSSVANIPTKELKELPMNDFMELIVEVVQKEEFKGFFSVVLKLLK